MPASPGKLAVLASAAVLFLIFCAYRILTYVPRPLDAPGTLRPVLYALFNRFIKHYLSPEQAQQAWGTYCLVALLIPTVLAFWNYINTRSDVRPPRLLHQVIGSRLLLFAGIAVSLIVCRFPYLLANEINPDETFFIAAAQKLFKDPIVFFRAIDFVTSGPLNVYPLMTPALFGISPDYASTRLVGLFIIFASIYVIYRTLALLADDATARIAVLPAAGAFAVLKQKDFLHYSSEHLSFLLLSLAIYICVTIFRRPQSPAWKLAGLGLLTAAAFLAKMQAVPILGTVALIAIAYVYGAGHAGRWWRPAMWFAAGLAPLLLLNAIICLAGGVWHDFWMEYIVGNYNYVEPHGTLTTELEKFADFAMSITDIRLAVTTLLAILAAYIYYRKRRQAGSDQALFLQVAAVGGVVAVTGSWLLRAAGGAVLSYAAIVSMLILPGSFLLLYRKPDWNPRPVQWFGLLAAAAVALAATVAYVPHRRYGHYLLLLIFPLTIAAAWTVIAASEDAASVDGEGLPGRRSPLSFLLVFGALTLACQFLELGSPDFMTFASVTPTVRAPESGLIDVLLPPAGRMAIWGWNGRPFIGSGRVTAVKDLIMAQLFLGNPALRDYYRAAYLRGLQRYRPELFLDAIDTSLGTFANRRVYGFEQIPEINAFVQANYVHIIDAYGERFYIRRDLAQNAAQALKINTAGHLYEIVSRLSGKALAVGDKSADNGAPIEQRDYAGGANQQWQLVPIDSTYYKIVSKLSGKVLDVRGGPSATNDGALIQQWDYWGGANQQWQLIPVDNQEFEIVSKLSGKALDVRGGVEATANGFSVQQWKYLGSPNQQWLLAPVQ